MGHYSSDHLLATKMYILWLDVSWYVVNLRNEMKGLIIRRWETLQNY